MTDQRERPAALHPIIEAAIKEVMAMPHKGIDSRQFVTHVLNKALMPLIEYYRYRYKFTAASKREEELKVHLKNEMEMDRVVREKANKLMVENEELKESLRWALVYCVEPDDSSARWYKNCKLAEVRAK